MYSSSTCMYGKFPLSFRSKYQERRRGKNDAASQVGRNLTRTKVSFQGIHARDMLYITARLDYVKVFEWGN